MGRIYSLRSYILMPLPRGRIPLRAILMPLPLDRI